MYPTFDCVECETSGEWIVRFHGPSPFVGLTTYSEVQDLCRKCSRVLLLGVFSWSNFSRHVVGAVREHSSWFEANNIGLAIFCLGNQAQAERVCPGFGQYFATATKEPIILVLSNASIAKAHFGPMEIDAIKGWVTSP